MKKLLILLCLISAFAYGQTSVKVPIKFDNGVGVYVGSTAPITVFTGEFWFTTTALDMQFYNGTSWQAFATKGFAAATYVPLTRTITVNGVTQDMSANRTFTITDITGNSGTATALQTARTINGVSFNGTANITVSDATKEPIISGTGFVKKSGTTTTFDNSTYYLASNPNAYVNDSQVSSNTNVAANTAARHSAVTLGTANGLSLSTQALSLGLSSGSTVGALSAADWLTFNGKQNALGYTPYNATNPNGYTSNTGTVTNVAATNGTGITWSISNPTTTPNISLSISIPTILGYTPANDAQVVHLTGNENIYGYKRLFSDMGVGSHIYGGSGTWTNSFGSPGVQWNNTDDVSTTSRSWAINGGVDGDWNLWVSRGTAPSNVAYWGLNFSSANLTLNYLTDVSANFGALSLVNKGYVDAKIASIVEVSGTSVNMVGNTTYIFHNSSLTTALLPQTNPPIGTLITMIGDGSGQFRIAQGPQSLYIVSGNSTTTVGETGYIQTSTNNTTITIRYVNTNKWLVTSSNSTPSIF